MSDSGNKREFKLDSHRPRHWTDPEELSADIESYFDWCKQNPIEVIHRNKLNEVGQPVRFNVARPQTIEGLARFLGTTRRTLNNYERKPGYEEFHSVIEDAKNRIAENKLEQAQAGTTNPAITIFDLKNNHGYKDSHEIGFGNLERLKEFFPDYEDGDEA